MNKKRRKKKNGKKGKKDIERGDTKNKTKTK